MSEEKEVSRRPTFYTPAQGDSDDEKDRTKSFTSLIRKGYHALQH